MKGRGSEVEGRNEQTEKEQEVEKAGRSKNNHKNLLQKKTLAQFQ